MFMPVEDLSGMIAADSRRSTREKLKHFLEVSGLKAHHIESAIGEKKGTAVEQYLAHGADDRQIEERLCALLGFDAEWPPEPTRNLQSVFEVCDRARTKGRMVAIGGRAGYGKSTALALYARVHGCIYYCYDEVSNNRDVLRALGYLAGSQALSSVTMGEILRRIVALVHRTRRPIIIDQADTLPFKSIEALRSIHDQTGVGIILAGLPDRLPARLQKRNEKEHAEQVQSRINAKVTLPPPCREDVELICARFGIRAQKSIDFVFQRAKVGGYRYVFMLCDDARDIAKSNSSSTVNFTHVKDAAVYLVAPPDSKDIGSEAVA